MKRLIVCCDGTWNTPDQEENGIPAPTNVFKIFNAIAEKDKKNNVQLKYYHPGVGSEGGVVESVLGGAIGAGISNNIRSAYHWLGCNYNEGDEIYLFGFSRGAFAARSLGGFLGRGLLDLKNLGSDDSWFRVKKAYDKGYRRKNSTLEDWAESYWKFFHKGQSLPINFVGVWETVGALGVPDDLEIINIFEKRKNWRFHDTELGSYVKTARHAMAIDEIRSSFTITRWNNSVQHPGIKELWFPGVHSDVGGGYADSKLSNGALLWMMEESSKVGLEFREGIQTQIKPDPCGVIHNSFKGGFAKLRSRPRNIDAMVERNKNLFHLSALERQALSPVEHPHYHPTKILKINETHTVDIFANTRWNYSGIYLPAGHSFTFSATGKWLDSKDACDWEGTEDGKLSAGDIIRGTSSFLGKFETIFKKITKNDSTDFLGTKRVENLKWFTLVGTITNDSGSRKAVKNDGSPVPHQHVDLAAHKMTPLKVDKPGYLYCFPNDVWSLYENNHGSVLLKIQRTS